MSQFEAELENFKRTVEALLEELEEAYEELRGPETEDYLHRLIAYITDFSYLVEVADDAQLKYISSKWPSKYLVELCSYFTEMVVKIDAEFRQIFKMEYNEILSRIRFYVKIPEGSFKKKAKAKSKKTGENKNSGLAQKKLDSSHPYFDILNTEGEQRKLKLLEHFKSWVVSPYCFQMLDMIMDSVVKCTVDGEDLKLDFTAHDGSVKRVRFGAAYYGDFSDAAELPESYKKVVTLHNEVMFGRGLPDGIHFLGYEQGPQSEFDVLTFNGDPDKFMGFCDIGYDWIVWNRETRNALDEPVMTLVRHNHPISTAKEFPSQQLIAYGFGGLIIRCMGYFLFPKMMMFKDFAWESEKVD